MAKKKGKKKKERKTSDCLVVRSKVKEYVKGKDFRLAGDAVDEMSQAVKLMLKKAMKRAEKNGKKAVRAFDL